MQLATNCNRTDLLQWGHSANLVSSAFFWLFLSKSRKNNEIQDFEIISKKGVVPKK